MLWNCIVYRCSIRDYFLLNFPLLNKCGKKKYITATESMRFYSEHNNRLQASMLDNKEELLKLFEGYIHRDWCGQKYHNTKEEYDAFAAKHKRFIMKPLDGSGGKGIEILKTGEISEGLYEFCKGKNVCIEELIAQHDVLSYIYPYAVNTVRLFTYNQKAVFAVLRMGTGTSNIDNASSGGVFSPIDISTGVLTGGAYSFQVKEVCISHPTTNVILPGIQLPYWDDCKKMVEEASDLVDGIPLIGWDVAITKNGPVVLEANSEPEIITPQVAFDFGVRKFIK